MLDTGHDTVTGAYRSGRQHRVQLVCQVQSHTVAVEAQVDGLAQPGLGQMFMTELQDFGFRELLHRAFEVGPRKRELLLTVRVDHKEEAQDFGVRLGLPLGSRLGFFGQVVRRHRRRRASTRLGALSSSSAFAH